MWNGVTSQNSLVFELVFAQIVKYLQKTRFVSMETIWNINYFFQLHFQIVTSQMPILAVIMNLTYT